MNTLSKSPIHFLTACAIVLFVGACSHRQVRPDRDAALSDWVTSLGPVAVSDVTKIEEVKNYLKSVSGGTDLLARFFRFVDPVQQPAVRMLVARHLLSIVAPVEWRDDWVGWGVESLAIVRDPLLRKYLSDKLLSNPELLAPEQWARWMRLGAGEDEPDIQLRYLRNWGAVEDDPLLKDVLIEKEKKTSTGRIKRKSPAVVLLPFSGPARAIGWRLGGGFLAGVIDSPGSRPLVMADSENAVYAGGVLVDIEAYAPILVGPFRKERIERFGALVHNLGLTQVLFNPSRKTGDIRVAVDPETVASALFDALHHTAGVTEMSLFVPASEYGDRFVRSFLKRVGSVDGVSIKGVGWYREDMADVGNQAKLLYGVDRVPERWLELAEEPMDVDGVVQHEICVIAGTPSNLTRIVRELQFYGSTLQAFAGDFGWNNQRFARDVNLDVPVLFVDHFTHGVTGNAVRYKSYRNSVTGLAKGGVTLPDLLYYEAGQFVADFTKLADGDPVELAGGMAKLDQNGQVKLDVYPMMISGGNILPFNIEQFSMGVKRQRSRYNAFQRLRLEVAKTKEEEEQKLLKEQNEKNNAKQKKAQGQE